jgi:co-chaperonin GroES (HSP10)
MSAIKPYGEKVILRIDGKPTMTDSGLHLPDDYQERKAFEPSPCWFADVVVSNYPDIPTGARVVVTRHVGRHFEHEGERLTVFDEPGEHIHAIVD